MSQDHDVLSPNMNGNSRIVSQLMPEQPLIDDPSSIPLGPWTSWTSDDERTGRTTESSLRGRHSPTNSRNDQHTQRPMYRTPTLEALRISTLHEGVSPTALKRALHWIHIFMISFGATVGMGFYVRTGTIHRIGGSSAVLYSYILLGVLSFTVMHPLTKMLRLWPIRAPLMSFVEVFVNQEIGLLVGVLYWLTYCFSYAALTTTIGELFESLGTPETWQGCVTFMSLALPLLGNLMDIRYLKVVELFCGMLKLLTALAVIIVTNFINTTVSSKKSENCTNGRDEVFVSEGPANWFGNLCASLYLASFAFVGIEVVAATAPEASLLKEEAVSLDSTSTNSEQSSTSENDLDDPFQLPAILVPLTATAIYTWGGWIVTQNLASCDARLPSLAWGTREPLKRITGTEPVSSSSIFVLSAGNKSRELAVAVTALLILNLISTSSTALFVASRSLFGLATRLVDDSYGEQAETPANHVRANRRSPRYFFTKLCRQLAKKNQFDVPYWAVWASCWLFWVPILRYKSARWASVPSDIAMELGSVCCILVWACESFAAFRLYRYFHKNPTAGQGSIRERLPIPQNALSYRFHRNVAFLAFSGCITIIILGGTFTFVHDMNPVHGISAFLMPAFFLVWTGIGYYLRNEKDKNQRFLNRLDTDGDHLMIAIRKLDNVRAQDLQPFAPKAIRWYNLWGIIFLEPKSVQE